MIKGFGDSVRSLCVKDTLEDQLQNLEEIFMENGQEEENVKEYLLVKNLEMKRNKKKINYTVEP